MVLVLLKGRVTSELNTAMKTRPVQVWDRLQSLPRRFRKETVNGLSAEWELRIGPEAFSISVADHTCAVRQGHADRPATIISTGPDTWFEIDEGRITGAQAWLDRRVEVSGNLELAVRLQTLFRPFRRARGRRDLDQVEVRAEDATLSCYVMGNGDPLLLLHGLGASKVSWLPLLGDLADKHQVIVPDLPGHGESEKPVTDYSPRFYARALRHLLDELAVDQAFVVGNSMGGRIALELALRSPTRVAGLGLLSPAVPGFRWRYVLGFTKVIPTEFGAIPFPLRERWMLGQVKRLFADPAAIPEEWLVAATQDFIRVYRSPRARMAFFGSLRQIVMERPDPFFASLRRVKQPALVVAGERDRLVPPRLAIRLIDNLPNAEALMLPDVGHVPQFEASQQTLETLQAFIKEH